MADPGDPRIPDDDDGSDYDGKRFAVPFHAPPQLAVTVADGEIAKGYGPPELVAKLTDKIGALLSDLAGGFPSMLYAVVPGQSLTLYFGDPSEDEAQAQISAEVTLSVADQVAELVDLEGDDLFALALRLGAPARRYAELAQLVDAERITMVWAPRGQAARKLSPARAAAQYERLTAESPMTESQITVNGILYRVIADPPSRMGTVGIRLHTWSAKPSGWTRRKLIAHYESDDVEAMIKAGLINEPVEARILIRQAAPGTSIDLRREFVVTEIYKGPSEDSRKGIPLDKAFPDDIEDGEPSP